MKAEAAAVVAGDGGMAVDGDVERVDEAVVFGDVVTGDDGRAIAAGGAVDLLVAEGSCSQASVSKEGSRGSWTERPAWKWESGPREV